jgi:hypothetical protein
MTVIGVISAKIDGWDTAPNTQYHIQTDEGPERFFKYQTISGQYRKEKRLQDGTVIGSYGWVDADGYLRLNDYIADNDGYRILKTKRMFVGPQTQSTAKSVSSSASSSTSAPLVSTKYVPAASANDVSSPAFEKAQPYVVEDKSKFLIFPSTTTASPVSIFPKRRPTVPSAYYPTSTPPNIVRESSDSVTEVAITPAPHYYVPASASKSSYPAYKATYNKQLTPFYGTAVVKNRPDYAQNSIVNLVNPYYGQKIYSPNRKSFDTAAASNYENGGITVLTRNGFKYYLPRQYHEEESSPAGNERAGSFGYIDPFGIRRVIYYNAAPGTGFVHRKSNRYVGFNATPYDPRPVPL